MSRVIPHLITTADYLQMALNARWVKTHMDGKPKVSFFSPAMEDVMALLDHERHPCGWMAVAHDKSIIGHGSHVHADQSGQPDGNYLPAFTEARKRIMDQITSIVSESTNLAVEDAEPAGVLHFTKGHMLLGHFSHDQFDITATLFLHAQYPWPMQFQDMSIKGSDENDEITPREGDLVIHETQRLMVGHVTPSRGTVSMARFHFKLERD